MLPPEVKEQLAAAFLLGGARAVLPLLGRELVQRGSAAVADARSDGGSHYVDFPRGDFPLSMRWIHYYWSGAESVYRVRFYMGNKRPSEEFSLAARGECFLPK